MREVLLPAGIDVQSRKYGTEDDPRGTSDLFVSVIGVIPHYVARLSVNYYCLGDFYMIYIEDPVLGYQIFRDIDNYKWLYTNDQSDCTIMIMI